MSQNKSQQKNQAVENGPKRGNQKRAESSDSDSGSDSEEESAPKKKPVPKKSNVVEKKKPVKNDSDDSDDSDDDVPKKKIPVTKAKAKVVPKKKAQSSSESESSSESDSDSESSGDDAPTKKRAPARGTKKPAPKKKVSSSSDDDDEQPRVTKAKAQQAAPKPKDEPAKKDKPVKEKPPKKEKGKKPQEPEDLDALLDEFSDKTADGQLSKAQAKRLKKKQAQTKDAKTADPLAPSLPVGSEVKAVNNTPVLPGTESSQPVPSQPIQPTQPLPESASTPSTEPLSPPTTSVPVPTSPPTPAEADKKLSKQQKKRLKEKEKKKEEAAAAAGGTVPGATVAPKTDKTKKGDKDKSDKGGGSAVARALKERLQKEKEKVERIAREEEEKRKREEEEEKKRIEDEKRAEEERIRKHEERIRLREEARKKGELKSKGEKAKATRDKQKLEQMKAQGLVMGPKNQAKPEAEQAESQAPTKRVVYGKKKKQPANQKKAVPNQAQDPVVTEIKTPVPTEPILQAEEVKKDAEKQETSAPVPTPTPTPTPTSTPAPVEEAEDLSWEDIEDPDQIKAKELEKAKQKELEKQKEVEKQKEAEKAKQEKETTTKGKDEKYEIVKENDKAKVKENRGKGGNKDKGGAKEKQEKKKIVDPRMPQTSVPSKPKTADKGKKGKQTKELRSPICCILGHVDTGKTKLLDKMRRTDVQGKEAGGITQQIGATFFPVDNIKTQTAPMVERESAKNKLEFQLPGLLVIDTPGHESFVNLRARGTNLCDIAVLVIDIMHGLEQQTIESIGLLKERKTPFVVALNKCDRLYGWKETPNDAFENSFAKQNDDVKQEFKTRSTQIITQLAQQSINAALYYANPDRRSYVSLVPTSAHTGEGIPDLLYLLVDLTQRMMADSLAYLSELQCTVLEVKVVEGLGYTIDVVLVNGWIHEGDTVVVCGLEGPIVTVIRSVLTPKPMRELRVKGSYIHHKEVKAAVGVKLVAPNLEHAVAGTQLLVFDDKRDDLEELKDEVQQDLATILSQVDKSGEGVYVQASTLGSLEALLSFLKTSKIPVSGMNIGPIHKKDVMRAATMLERKVEYATILAFDVKLSADAKKMADEMGVKIFQADIIYHLFDQMTKYLDDVRMRERDKASAEAVFPVVLEILPAHIFRVKGPMLFGVRIEDGVLKLGTPLCVVPTDKKELIIGRVESIERNHEEVKEAKKGDEVAVKINQEDLGQHVMYGRHFDFNDRIYSLLTRRSIDLLKANFKDDLDEQGWRLVVKLKKMFNII